MPQSFDPRRCVLCHLPFERPSRVESEEHAFPQWLEKHVPSHSRRRVDALNRGSHKAPNIEYQRRRIGTYQQTVKGICEPCNHWMNETLEIPMQRTLPPLLRGEQTNVSRADQALLAAWAWKTATMLFRAGNADHDVSPDETHRFRMQPAPPEPARVWIGSLDAEPLGRWSEAWHGWSTTLVHLAPPEKAGTRGVVYAMVFTVGAVCFMIAGADAPDRLMIGPWPVLSPFLTPIWPPEESEVSFTWPTTAVTSAHLDAFTAEAYEFVPRLNAGLEWRDASEPI
jgi:hypothetical protein